MSDSPAAAGTVICLTDPPITNFYNILTGHHLAEALTEWRELMWGTSRSEQCKERTAAEALFALPIFLGLTIQRTAADYQHLCAKAFFQICGRGFCLAQHPGSARDLTSSGSSPQAITDQSWYQNTPSSLRRDVWRCVCITVFQRIFPGIGLQWTSVLTCWIRQRIGCFPFPSLPSKFFLHLQNTLLALESSPQSLLLGNLT